MDVTDSSFNEKEIEASKDKLVVVDFWADWCGPCTTLGPVIEKVVDSYGDKVALAKVNVDENPEKPAEYGANSIPTVKIIKDGKIVQEFVGAIPEEQIRELIDKALQ